MILEVIARARRRLLWNAMAAQGARVVCVSLGLLILLLLVGTDILDWRYLLCIPAASLLAGAYYTWIRLPGVHDAARLLDHRLGLLDAISTALFFWPADPHRDFDEGMRQAQRESAARIAAGIDVNQVLPLRLPKLVYGGVALAVMACGLAGWRYSVHGWLDLRHPAAPAVAHLIDELKTQVANLEQFLRQFEPDRPELDKAAMLANLAEKGDTDSKSDSKGDARNPNGDGAQAEKQDSTMASDNPSENNAGQQGEAPGEGQEANEGKSSEQRNRDGQQGRQDSGSSASDANPSGSDSSLMNKVRDTMANLLSAMKPQPAGSGGSRMEAEGKAKQQGGKSSGKAGAGERQETASSSPSQGDPQQGDPQAGKGGSPSTGQPGAESEKQAGSGAGRDEGDKQIKLAEERQAMGKISVILGKRSLDVTGSTSMEVVSGEQTLKTQYENRQARHAAVEDRGERDQVPVDLQNYVRQYLQAARASATRSTGHASRDADVTKQK
jgi:hypothetical protein